MSRLRASQSIGHLERVREQPGRAALIDYRDGGVIAQPVLFLEGAA